MKRTLLVLAGLLAVDIALLAQTATSRTSSSASSNTSLSASPQGAQVNSDNSVSAAQETEASRPSKDADTRERQKSKSKDKDKASASGTSSAGASAETNDLSAALSAGSTIQAELIKGIDSRKAREGDAVAAKVTQDVRSQGRVVVAKGSKLIGHVTQARARAKGDADSTLAIAFDRAALKGGQQASLHAIIRALAAPVSSAPAAESWPEPMETGGGSAAAGASGSAGTGGMLGGVNSTLGTAAGGAVGAGQTAGGVIGGATSSTLGSATQAAGSAVDTTGRLTSSGVVNLPGITLNSQASSSASGSVIASSGKSVRLNSGTRLLLSVTQE